MSMTSYKTIHLVVSEGNGFISTASPRLTRILRPEKNRVMRNCAVGGLWDYTMQK